MTLIDSLNQTWEGRLGNLEARMWQRMKALGVIAYWEDPLEGRPSTFTEQLNDGPIRRVLNEELYEFVVVHENVQLTKLTKHQADYDAVVITALVEAANKLEKKGIPVIRD